MLAKLPTREDRRQWLQRIIDHDGRTGDEGGIEAWLHLGEAASLSREDLLSDRLLLAGGRFAVDAYVNFVRLQPYVEAVASSLTELFAPSIMSVRMAAFRRHYTWVRPEGLRYFESRLTQAPRDAMNGLAFVQRHARTRAEQERCVAAISFKCDVLWSLLDAVQQAAIETGDTHEPANGLPGVATTPATGGPASS